jgi:transcriptional regulator with XRE-family HTH domain
MTLGEQLKQLRQARGLSQPEFSAMAGIEQSYLSKLENDKSMPSNEIFRHLLGAFELDLDQFLAGFKKEDIQRQLSAISDVENWLNKQQKGRAEQQRNYLYTCSALIVIAVTLFYVGFSKQVFNETRYEYESIGIILAGEPNDVFSSWPHLMAVNKERTAYEQKKVAMAKRRDEVILLTFDNLGTMVVRDVPGGKRRFRLDKEETLARSVNAWLQVFGVFLFSAGIMGFVVERRLFKH